MKVATESQCHISTDEQIATPVSPAHEEPPASSEHRTGESVASPSERVTAGEFCVRQCNAERSYESKYKGKKHSWSRNPSRRSHKDKDSSSNCTPNPECESFRQAKLAL